MTGNNETADTETDGIERPDHILTFDETAYRSVSHIPIEEEPLSVGDIEPEEYKTLESAECSCGEHFDTHEDGLDHLHSVRAGTQQEANDE